MLGIVVLLGACVGSDTGVARRPDAGDVGDPDLPDAPDPSDTGDTAGTPDLPTPGWGRPSALHGLPEEDDGPGDVLFRTDVLHALSLTIDDASLASLRVDPRTEVPAVLAWRGDNYVVGVKLKGTTSFRTIDEKPALKIDAHAYDPDQELDGLERITLNNMIQDGSMLREHGYYWLFHRLGLPAPRHAYAQLTVNDVPYGVYGLLETIDEQYLGHAFPDDRDGNLYEGQPADFTSDHDWFQLEEDGGVVPVWEDMDALVDAVETAGVPGFDAMLSDRFDRDRVLDYLAVDMVTGNADGYVYNFHNHLPYHAAIADDWTMIPWGADQAFRLELPPLGDPLTKPAEGYLFTTCWDDPVCGPDLRARANVVLDLVEDELPDVLDDAKDLVEDACAADDRREQSCSHDSVLDYVAARPAYLRSSL